MTRVVYVNGCYQPYHEAAIHPEDRGFLFGDAVYEVCQVTGGKLVDEGRHLARLFRSLGEIDLDALIGERAVSRILHETVRRNRVKDGFVYLQISRGAGPREFTYPKPGTPPTIVCLARAQSAGKAAATAATGISVITVPDIRWGRPDIKTVQLLPAAMAKEVAKRAGAKEAWLVDGTGHVTEGASSNAWIITRDGAVVTRPADTAILRGVTRMVLLDGIATAGLRFEERSFSVDEAKAAAEAFITSASNIVTPVIRIDGVAIADGVPGPKSKRLRELFHGVSVKT